MSEDASDKKPMMRPLSPHIQIYRWTLTMALSILHRATGLALYGGTLLLAWWLLAAASNTPQAYALVQETASAWYGRLILFGYSWALFHHMFGGLRHFVWDMGLGFELKNVEILAWGSAIMPLVLTLAVWLAAYFYMGVL